MDARIIREFLTDASTHATALMNQGCDPNELGKAIRLLISLKDMDRLINVLDTLAKDPDAHQSRQTQGYIVSVLNVVRSVKGKTQGNVDRAIQILGWTHRKLRAKAARARAAGGGPSRQQGGRQGGFSGTRR